MSVKYVRLEVEIHGLDAESVDSVEERAKRALNGEFSPLMHDDIEVEVLEAAGEDL